jgi:hypothetical protein
MIFFSQLELWCVRIVTYVVKTRVDCKIAKTVVCRSKKSNGMFGDG